MSTEDVSNNISKQTGHSIHPFHVEKVVRHAIRNIKGGPELADEVYNKKNTYTYRLPDHRDDQNDELKHFWN